jgi:plastocyanin
MPMTNNPAPRRRRHARLFAPVAVIALSAGAILALMTTRTILAADAPQATIRIANFTFAPPDLTVAAGTIVTWKNADDSPHRIADKNGAYASPALDTEDSYSRTFATPGVYPYICSIHPYMVGKIVVRPAGKSS